MAHPRKTIRQALAALLVDKTDADARVYSNRSRPQSVNKLPAIGIYNVGDSAQLFDESPRRYRRRFSLAIDCYIKYQNEEKIDDELDDFADQVERVVFSDTTISGTVADVQLSETSDVMVGTQRENTAMLTITWTATLYQDAPEEDAGDLEDMSATHVDWDIPEGEDVDAEDDIALPVD